MYTTKAKNYFEHFMKFLFQTSINPIQ
ncbi:hypothetical protein V617_00311 [Staphylococcus aureus M57746]|nr:hypothetical protein V617_00311 [Staphylococcus aureus M57746]